MPPDRQSSPRSNQSHETQLHACARCKVRKKKCDRVHPKCSTCARSNIECNYDVPSVEMQQKALTADNDAQKARVAQLQERVDAMSTARSAFVPAPPFHSPASSLLDVSNLSAAPIEPTNAERIVLQLLEGEVDLMTTQQSLRANTAHQLGLPLNSGHAGRPDAVTLTLQPSMVNRSLLPDITMTRKLIDMFFNYTNCFHPVLDRDTVAEDMRLIYPTTPRAPSLLDNLTEPDIHVFRLFMVLAIGSNILPKSNHCDSSQLRACASAHLAAALRADTLTCMASITLYCIVALTDSALMDPYQNIRRAARLTLDLGYHQDDERLSFEVREKRKRIFWSVYGMDRAVSFALIRPVTITESEIGTSLPQTVPELSQLHQSYMHPISLFHQTVLLRRLQGIVVTEISLGRVGNGGAEDVSARVRNQIDSWYEVVVRSSRRPNPWPYLEVNYHLLLVRLYSPSSLLPRTPPAAMSTLRDSAYRVVEMYGAERSDHRIAQNHITLSHIVACCVALVYTLTEYEGSPTNIKLRSWRARALQQLEAAEMYMVAFCSHSELAEQYPVAFRRLVGPVRAIIKEADAADEIVDEGTLPPLDGFVGMMPDTGSEATLFDSLSAVADHQEQLQQTIVPWDYQNHGFGTLASEAGNTDLTGENFDDFFTSFGLGAFSN